MNNLAAPLGLSLALALAVAPLAAGEDAAVVTFNRDVAPILFARCAECHRPGEIAPMSLLSYDDARPWAKTLRRVVAERSMPPWHADSSRVAYKNDRSLSQEEIDTIVRWVNQGARRGNPQDLPPTPQFTEGWQLGPPDRVFRAKKGFVIPDTEEEIPYQSVTFHVDVEEDLYLRAWEIRPQVLKAVHHANLVRSPVPLEGQDVTIAEVLFKGGDYIGSYLPGHSYEVYPEGMAYRMPKGSQLGIQVHYVSVGEEIEDEIVFGVYYSQGRVDKLVRVVGTDYRAINIPPHKADYTVVDEVTLLYDVYALSSGIHMHLRGKSYTMEGVAPDGTVTLLADVPNYDFNWQSTYRLAEPRFLPRDSKLRVTSVWDNSAANRYNPDPDSWVRYGPWTDDEMVNSWSHVVLAEEKLGLRVVDGVEVGRFDDAQESSQPFLLQSLPQAKPFHQGEAEASDQGSED